MVARALVAIVVIGAAPAVELRRDIDIDDAAHYHVANHTSRVLLFGEAELQLAVRQPDGGWLALSGPPCTITEAQLLPTATLDLGQWDELCFGGGLGVYRATLQLHELDGGRGPLAATEFALWSTKHTHLLRPYPQFRLRREATGRVSTTNATACTCSTTTVGLGGPAMGPLGDYPLPRR